MNIERLNQAIAVMERTTDEKVDMSFWQIIDPDASIRLPASTESSFHACGNKACFAGHIAISPEWRSSSVIGEEYTRDEDGAPMIAYWQGGRRPARERTGSVAIATWLNTQQLTADLLCYKTSPAVQSFTSEWFDLGHRDRVEKTIHPVYGAVWHEVTRTMVINALIRLRDGGEIAFLLSAEEAIKKGTAIGEIHDLPFYIPDIVALLRRNEDTDQQENEQ